MFFSKLQCFPTTKVQSFYFRFFKILFLCIYEYRNKYKASYKRQNRRNLTVHIRDRKTNVPKPSGTSILFAFRQNVRQRIHFCRKRETYHCSFPDTSSVFMVVLVSFPNSSRPKCLETRRFRFNRRLQRS